MNCDLILLLLDGYYVVHGDTKFHVTYYLDKQD